MLGKLHKPKTLKVWSVETGKELDAPMSRLEIKLVESVPQTSPTSLSISEYVQQKARELGFDYLRIEQNHTYPNGGASRMTVYTINYYKGKWWVFW